MLPGAQGQGGWVQMPETLFVELDLSQASAQASANVPDADSRPPVSWALLDDSGLPLAGGTEQDLAEQLDDFTGEVVATVPASAILRTQAEVPSRQHRQIVQAVPFVVEEQLAMDVEECFFALGGRAASGAIAVAITDRGNMLRWQEQLADLGLAASARSATCAKLLPRSELLPATAGVEALVNGDHTLVRWADGMSLEIDTAQLAMTIALLDNSQKPHINIHVAEHEQASIELQLRELEASEPTPPQLIPLEGSASSWLYHNYLHAKNLDPINLFQGEYKVEVKQPGDNLVWRSIAGLAGCALAMHLLSLLGQGIYLSVQADDYQSAYQTLYQEVFPADRNVRDYRRRWNRHLGQDSTSNEFLSLFARSTASLGEAGLTLRNINFNESRGDLVIQVLAGRSEALVEYAETLTQQGMIVEIGTISQDGAGVQGSIRVKTGGRS